MQFSRCRAGIRGRFLFSGFCLSDFRLSDLLPDPLEPSCGPWGLRTSRTPLIAVPPPVFQTSSDLTVTAFNNLRGDKGIRTLDPLLAKQVLSQLSYTPFKGSGSHLLSHTVSSIVSSAVRVLTIVFGMGTGVTPGRIAAGIGIKWTRTTDLALIRRAL